MRGLPLPSVDEVVKANRFVTATKRVTLVELEHFVNPTRRSGLKDPGWTALLIIFPRVSGVKELAIKLVATTFAGT